MSKIVPKIKEPIDIDRIVKICKNYVNFVYSDDYHEDNDYDHYIFEDVLMSVYGNDIFDKLNEIMQDR
jgi:hypothetical protein